MLTGKELSIALLKAVSANIPVAGAFVSEGIGAIDQHAATLELNERLELLESELLKSGDASLESVNFARTGYHCTSNYLKLMSSYESFLKESQSLEKYIVSLEKGEMADFEYFSLKAKIPIVHDLLSKYRLMGCSGTNLARAALVSLSTKVLAHAKIEDDVFLKMRSGSSPSEMKEYGYLGDAWQELGMLLINERDFHNAIRCFFRSIELDSDPMVPLLNIANCFRGLGMLGYAINKYEHLARKYPFSLQIRYRLASGLDELGSKEAARLNYEILCNQIDERKMSGAKFQDETLRWRQIAEEYIKENKQPN